MTPTNKHIHTTSLTALRWLLWGLLLLGVFCSGCELWGDHCQKDSDCNILQRCQQGFCLTQPPPKDASPHDGGPTKFQPRYCSCPIPSCEATTETACQAASGCKWQQIPKQVGPFLCAVDREASCQTEGNGVWKERCQCKDGYFLYGGLLCLPNECTGACRDPQKQTFVSDKTLLKTRAETLHKALVLYLDSTGTSEWSFLKNKTLDQPLLVEHRRLESNYPLRWRVIDHYAIVPMVDQKKQFGTWLLLNGADATLKEIAHAPELFSYPPIDQLRAGRALADRVQGTINPNTIELVAISKPDNIDGLQTLKLFPLWRFFVGAEEYFVTTFTEIKGKPLVYRSMSFDFMPPPKK